MSTLECRFRNASRKVSYFERRNSIGTLPTARDFQNWFRSPSGQSIMPQPLFQRALPLSILRHSIRRRKGGQTVELQAFRAI